MQKWWSFLFGGVLGACLLLFLVAPFVGWWLPRDVCVFGPSVDWLFYLILAITGFFFVLTEAILVYAMYRFAGQGGRKSTFIHGSHRLELAWTAVPAIILLLIAFTQVRAWEIIKYVSRMPAPKQVFEVSARQFEWRIRYPSSEQLNKMAQSEAWKNPKDPTGASREAATAAHWSKNPHADDVHLVNEIHTWKDADVRLYLKTRDVIHSFFLPHLRIKQDALPGKTIPVWFKATEANTHWDSKTQSWVVDKESNWELACAELCGWGHYKMRGKLYVHDSKEDYEKWLGQARAAELRSKP